jgi:hypothetical protein
MCRSWVGEAIATAVVRVLLTSILWVCHAEASGVPTAAPTSAPACAPVEACLADTSCSACFLALARFEVPWVSRRGLASQFMVANVTPGTIQAIVKRPLFSCMQRSSGKLTTMRLDKLERPANAFPIDRLLKCPLIIIHAHHCT